jgi:signal transduction histidine kinase
MNIESLKQGITARLHQLVVLDRQGLLIGSCDSLIPLKQFLGMPIIPQFALLQGLEDAILHLLPNSPALLLPWMDFEFEGKSYRFSHEFWMEAEEDGIFWLMSTDEHLVSKLRQIQQDRNETFIGLERVIEHERLLREYTNRLEQSHQTLQRFAYIVSHDLRASLRGIANLGEWIGESIETGDHAELPNFLRLLSNRLQRMEDLIDGIFRYHKAGHDNQDTEWLDLREMLLEIHDTVFGTNGTKMVLPESIPSIYASRTKIYQIFSNLFDNVYKYAKLPGSHFEIQFEEVGLGIKFSVVDHGPGIDPRNHERIFEMFHTLKSKDEESNTGIGLTIVKRLVEEAGGKVGVESSLGNGATFWFVWPKGDKERGG